MERKNKKPEIKNSGKKPTIKNSTKAQMSKNSGKQPVKKSGKVSEQEAAKALALKKKKKKTTIIVSLLCAFILAVGGVLTFVFRDMLFPEKPYDVSGIVMIDGSPAANFTVYSNKGTAVTDEEGRYVFKDITGEISISVSDDTYYFNISDKSFSDKAIYNINGKKYRDLSGTVVSGSSVVAFAKVTITAENGVYETYSDENGEFEIPKVVGKITITAEKDGMELFEKVVNSNENETVVKATTNFTLNFNFDVPITDFDEAGIEVEVNGKEYDLKENSITLTDIGYGSVVTVLTDKYGFETKEFTVTEEDASVDVDGYKVYDVQGQVNSGAFSVEGVAVYLDGEKVTETDADGKYVIENVYKSHTVTFEKDGFTSFSATVDALNGNLNFETLKKVAGEVKFEGNGQEDVKVYTASAEVLTDADGKYSIECKLGETIAFDLEGYHIEGGETVDESLETVNALSEKYYTLNITVMRQSQPVDAKVIVGETEYTAQNGVLVLDNIYGAKTLEVSCEGYIFDYPTSVSRINPSVVVTAQKLIDITGTVGSGALVLDGKVYFDGEFVKDFTGGAFTLDDIVEGGTVTVKCDGYDEYSENVSETNTEVTADLTYSVTLSAKTGDERIAQWTAVIGSDEYEVDGQKVIDGLKGELTVAFKKDYHLASPVTVTKAESVTFDVTYEITTSVMQNGSAVEGWKIILIDVDSEEKVEKTTDVNGECKFSDLSGEYVLFTVNAQGVAFKPNSYLVNGGGVYNFSDSGYSFGGKITCGGVGLASVKLVAEGKTVYTDENGEYSFEMLSSDTTLVISKTGYVFDKNGLDISEAVNGTEIDITATYGISGKVVSGETAMEGVSVTLGAFNTVTDVNGEYAISGINVVGETLTFSKDGFTFENSVVNGYGEFNQNATVNLTFETKSGTLSLSGVTVKANGKEVDKYYLGDIITFEKTGYVFESVTVTAGGNIVANGTYTVTGKVVNGDNNLENATVVLNGVDYTVSADGFFTISGLDGENVITAKYGEFDFTVSNVNAPCSVVVSATYTANFTVTCGIDPLTNVLIKIAGKEVYTDSEGKVTVNGLSGKNNIEVIKDGYTITGETRIIGAGDYVYTSTYAISGKVTCGSYALEGVTVQSGAKIVTTNAYGEFIVSGLTGVNEFTVSLAGYETKTFEVSAPSNNTVDLRYQVVINFTGVADCSGITVSYNGGQIVTENNSKLTLGYFEGTTRIELSKSGYELTPAVINPSRYQTFTVSVVKIYSITGTVKTKNGLPVVGYTVTAGGKSDITDANGYYEISGLKESNQINGSYQLPSGNYCTMSPYTIYGEGNYDFNSIKDEEYAKGLFLNGYNNLLIGQSYEIIGLGDVVGKSMGQTKNTKSGVVKRKDTKGNIVTENINHGSKVPVIGIDPSVATMSFYDASTNSIKYKRLKDGDTNGTINSNLDGDYSKVSWSTWTPDQYLSNMGNPVTGALPYNLTASTMQSVSAVAKKSGAYELSFNLDVNNQANYKKQTEFLASGSGASFNSIKLTVTINLNGFITKVVANENYKITVDGFEADTTTTMTFNINMPSFDFKIADIDVDNNLSTALSKNSSMEVK